MIYKHHLTIALLGLSLSLSAASTQCNGIYFNNQAPDILNAKLTPKTRELCYSTFAIVHSGLSRTPLWSAEHLTKNDLRSKNERTNDFHPEDRIGADERAELSDYTRSGFDRGHLSPAADMPTVQAEHECFTLANMIPQDSNNNRGIWSAIEGATRHLTNVRGELYVITGPVFMGNALKRIGGRILVPTKIYKAIYDPTSGKGAAYLVDNVPGNNYQVVSIAQIEQLSGISLFPKMSASTKQSPMALPEPRLHDGKSSTPQSALPRVEELNPQCGTKTTCREMSSCEEAKFYYSQCDQKHLDGTGNGIPCKKLCR